jgi:ankyrin repeat protein
MQAGADPQRPPTVGVFAGKNSLMWAASQGRTEVVRFLISANVQVDYSSDSGNFKVSYLFYYIMKMCTLSVTVTN